MINGLDIFYTKIIGNGLKLVENKGKGLKLVENKGKGKGCYMTKRGSGLKILK